MKALVYEGARSVVLRDVSKPSAGDLEVLVETKSVGICGSDLGIYKGEFPKIKPPLTIGHEGGGIVRDVGRLVKNIKVGDRVAVSPIVGCGSCEYCLQGRYSLCDNLKTIGMIDINGEYAEYFVTPERNCHVIPEQIEWESAGLIDTLAGPVLAIGRSHIPLGATVVIFGPGPAGLLFARLVQLKGAHKIILVGTRDERLALAPQYGVDETINVKREDAAKRIFELTEKRGADVVIEASGSPKAIHDGVKVLRKGGEIILYGVFDEKPVPIDLLAFVLNEYSCFGIADNTMGYPLAIDLLTRGTVDVKPLISHVLSLQELPQAFSGGMIEHRKEGYIKGVVRFK
jgi:L-iditol 2-dehydrogenase